MTPVSRLMKGLLEGVLPEGRYAQLARLRRYLVSPRLYPLLLVRKAVECRTLPDAILLDLKDGINLTGKMDYARHDIFLHVDSMTEYETRLHSCRKEPDTVYWIETFMKEGDVFFDVGANVGAYSLVAAKFYNDTIKVYSFEPAFPNFAQLCKNIYLNNCQHSVIPLLIALSDKTSVGRFHYQNLIPGGALHTFGEAIDYKGEVFTPVFTQYMMSYRLDDLIDQFGIPKPNHIKIDVDGIERAVLEGAQKVLSNPSLRSLNVELEDGESERQITELLRAKGFKFHSKHERWTPGMLNCIFSRETF